MRRFLRRLRNDVLILGGIVLSIYAILCILEIDTFAIGRYTPGSRDGPALPFLLLATGVISLLYGLIDNSNHADDSDSSDGPDKV
jgi:hypothetical protein